jgi:hypothetical protein
VSFTPLAQRHLAARLQAAPAGTVTLPVPLKFRSHAAGRLEISSKVLEASYVARPFGLDKHTLKLAGDRTELAFDVPSGVTPSGNSFRLTVRTRGRERDAASPETPQTPPVHGLQANQSVRIAAAMPATGRTIAAVRLYLAVPEPAEAVLDCHADAAGGPGEVLGKPAVRQLEPSPPGWIDFSLPAPVSIDGPRLWLALRTNKGAVLWFADATAAGAPAVSVDQGRTWGVPEFPIAARANLMAQALVPPAGGTGGDTPIVRLEREGTVLDANLLANAIAGSGNEYSVPAARFDVSALGAPSETGAKVTKRFALASALVADVTIEDFVVTYDPGQAPVPLGA